MTSPSFFSTTTPDERHAAIEHLDFAIAEFQYMKMPPALEWALGRRGLLKAWSTMEGSCSA